MNPAALVVLVALGWWLLSSVQTSAQRRNPARRRKRRPTGGDWQPDLFRGAGIERPNVFAPGLSRAQQLELAREEMRQTGQRDLFDFLAERQRNPRFVQTSAQRCCRCGSGYPCRPNPYTTACRIGPGHVFDFRHGGPCQCCGRMAPRRLVTLEWDRGGQTDYGRTCAGRAIGTTKLRTNQLVHMQREAAHQAARSATYGRERRERSRIQRPPWARGWSEADIEQLARRVGASAFEPDWWQSSAANLVPGHYERRRVASPSGAVGYVRGRYVPPTGEYRRYVLEGGRRSFTRRLRGASSRARSTRVTRAYRPPSDLPF